MLITVGVASVSVWISHLAASLYTLAACPGVATIDLLNGRVALVQGGRVVASASAGVRLAGSTRIDAKANSDSHRNRYNIVVLPSHWLNRCWLADVRRVQVRYRPHAVKWVHMPVRASQFINFVIPSRSAMSCGSGAGSRWHSSVIPTVCLVNLARCPIPGSARAAAIPWPRSWVWWCWGCCMGGTVPAAPGSVLASTETSCGVRASGRTLSFRIRLTEEDVLE